jgi:putative endonuclease
MAGPHDLGRRGEALAAVLLQERGWTILARNFRLGHKEIDLVARRDGIVAFIEVKTRAGMGYGHPLEAITRAQRLEIAQVARAWIARHGRGGELYRFDAIAVLWQAGTSPIVEHLEDAWRL